MQKKSTIIICTFNGASRLPKVLDCILRQDGLNNYVQKILVVDNHSLDNTKDVIQQWKLKSELVDYLYEDAPGLSNARRKGIINCNTQWTIFLDDDNYITERWLSNIFNYIDENAEVGAFNGAVIPTLDFSCSDDERRKLKSSLKVLACTHYDKQDLLSHPASHFRNPIGAGLVILTAPLKSLLKRGWLNSPGRTKNNLTSGEDGEMSFYVKRQGYKFGFCSNAILYHEIPRKRLDTNYLDNLWFATGKGVATVMKELDPLHILRYIYLLAIQLRKLQKKDSYWIRFQKKYINGYLYELKS